MRTKTPASFDDSKSNLIKRVLGTESISPFQGYDGACFATQGGAALCPGLACSCPFGAVMHVPGHPGRRCALLWANMFMPLRGGGRSAALVLSGLS